MLQRLRDTFGRWVFGIVLALIAVSFIFWGVDFNLTGPSYAARVNGEEVSLDEFERDLQFEQNQFQELYRVELDEELRRQLRRSVIDRLIRQSVLKQRIEEAGYRVSNERLTESIRSIPLFQVGGEFSVDAYRGQLALQGLSPTGFEALQREQLALMDLQLGIVNSAFVSPSEQRRYIELANQRRQAGYALFEADAFAEQVEIGEEEIAAHYEQNAERYMTEAAAALEYVELSLREIASQIEVAEEELEDYYEQRREDFRTEEERRASHILITADEGESEEEALARAEALVERIRAGEDFETLAAELSDDPGTASGGGDLGWISPGMLAGPFEEALYAMEEVGGIEGPVRSDFGYHIIRLDEVREGEERSFAEVRDELLETYRTQRAEDLFFDRANELADRAFDAYDELAGVAEELGLALKKLERYPRSGDPAAFPNNAPIVAAVFGMDELDVGVNSALLELSDDHVVVVRVTERFAPEQRPLDEVAEEIRERLVRERADTLASGAAAAFEAALPAALSPQLIGLSPSDASGDEGRDAPAEGAGGEAAASGAEHEAAGRGESEGGDLPPIAELAAEHGGEWIDIEWIPRSDPNVPSEVLSQAFDLPPPAEGAPARATTRLASGYAVVILAAVEAGDPDAVSAAERRAQQQMLAERIANAELGAYAGALREQAEVMVPDEVLNPRF